MTVKRSKGRKRRLCCDFPKCSAEYGEPFDRDMIVQISSHARMHGWHVTKDKFGTWRHECPNHIEDKGPKTPARRPAPAAPAQRFRADIDG